MICRYLWIACLARENKILLSHGVSHLIAIDHALHLLADLDSSDEPDELDLTFVVELANRKADLKQTGNEKAFIVNRNILCFEYLVAKQLVPLHLLSVFERQITPK